MKRLDEIAEQISQRSQPPVHTWAPAHHGEIDIRIDPNGVWFHEGEQIHRDAMVVLFSSILWCEDDTHYLVTPAEKLKIQVDDVPFIIHQAEFTDGHWVVITNTHEQVIVGVEHSVQLREYNGQQLPYVNIRYDLWARLSRSVYFQWVESALDQEGSNEQNPSLMSGDYQFSLL